LRRGGVSTGNSDGQEGQFYIGSEIHVDYTSETGGVTEGQVVTQVSSGATGVVVSKNTTTLVAILRSTRGVFVTDQNIEFDGGNRFNQPHVLRIISPIKQAAFGTFAGGVWFCAPGVALINVPGADANNFQLTDDENNIVAAPVKVTASIANTRALDSVAMFRLDAPGGVIKKDEYAGTVQSAGATTAIMGASITADTPPAGALRLVGTDELLEYRLRYDSFATTTFTLASTTGLTMDGASGTTTIIDAAGNFDANAKVGDLIRNTTAGVIGYVTVVNSDTQLTTTFMAGQTVGDAYEINTLPIATDTSDTWYVPLIDIQEDTGTDGTPGTEEAIITYLADIEVRARVRQAGVILPFETDGTVGTGGLNISAIRTPDSIFT
jgi:hypothetical protein